jgi:hypothetical protein
MLNKKSYIAALLQKLTVLSEKSEGLTTREKQLLQSFKPSDIAPNPFKDLPNVSRFGISTNVVDPLFASHGVIKKLAPRMQFKQLSRRTKAANRYMRIMYYRLTKLLFLGRPVQYWILALKLMRDSKVLRALALRKVLPNWHRTEKFGRVRQMLKSLDKMINDLPWQLKIQRQYEPKPLPSGGHTWRPVGNPAYVDRMFLYIWQCFLVIFLNKYISPSQHAYRPGKGVATALSEVQELLKSKPFA